MADNKKNPFENVMKHIKAFTAADQAESTDGTAEEDNGIVPQLKVSTREQTPDESFFSKLSVLLSERAVLGGIIVYAVFVLNLIGMAVFAGGSGLRLTQSVLYQFHIDSIAFRSVTFSEVNVLVSYIFAFVFGGAILFAMLRIGVRISELCQFIYSHKLTRWFLFAFMLLFALIALIRMLTGNGIFSVSVGRWAAPLFAFGGGLAMYCMSLRQVEID